MKKLEEIECNKGIIYVEPKKDRKGYFYSFCLNPEYRGLITNLDRCENSECKYHAKMYIKDINNLDTMEQESEDQSHERVRKV